VRDAACPLSTKGGGGDQIGERVGGQAERARLVRLEQRRGAVGLAEAAKVVLVLRCVAKVVPEKVIVREAALLQWRRAARRR